MSSVALLTSGVFLCLAVSYEFWKGLTADFSFSLLHVGVKVGGSQEVSLDFGQVWEISSGCPGNDNNGLGAEWDNFFLASIGHCLTVPLGIFLDGDLRFIDGPFRTRRL